MILNALKCCVEVCVDFFLRFETYELQRCDSYNESCQVCNPHQHELK
jgi:hypothetical protein